MSKLTCCVTGSPVSTAGRSSRSREIAACTFSSAKADRCNLLFSLSAASRLSLRVSTGKQIAA